MDKFNKIVALDTIIFYPEHEELLKQLVNKPKIERVPLKFDSEKKEWTLPLDYEMPKDATIIIWPSSLPTSFDGISLELHEKLKTSQCWTEAGLRDSISAQNLYNRLKDADCILTCWTDIPNEVLDKIIKDGKTKAIITWTHEFEHRLDVEKTRTAKIFTESIPDYGTDSVAELVFDDLIKLIERNKETKEKAYSDSDYIIGVLSYLFHKYRKSYINERDTRRGQFSHQFHKLGRSQEFFSKFHEKTLDEMIPEKELQGKSIGLYELDLEKLEVVLEKGFKMHLSKYKGATSDARFYRFIAMHNVIILDSSKISKELFEKIKLLKSDVIDLQTLKHYDEILCEKTLGIIGLGRIGSRVAEIAESFNMKVQYFSASKKTIKYDFVKLDDLLKTSDVVSMHVKAHKAIGLLKSKEISLMKKGAYFINTSDANALDQEPLTKRMLAKDLYVALDVYQGLPTTKTLFLNDNFSGKVKDQLKEHVLTYRAGWKTQEAIRVKTYKLLGHMIDALQ